VNIPKVLGICLVYRLGLFDFCLCNLQRNSRVYFIFTRGFRPDLSLARYSIRLRA